MHELDVKISEVNDAKGDLRRLYKQILKTFA